MTSLVFKPTRKDNDKLSVYDGDMIDPESAFNHFVNILGFQSAGVLGVSVAECEEVGLRALSDPHPFPEHAVVDFTGHTGGSAQRIAGVLRNKSIARGWLHEA